MEVADKKTTGGLFKVAIGPSASYDRDRVWNEKNFKPIFQYIYLAKREDPVFFHRDVNIIYFLK